MNVREALMAAHDFWRKKNYALKKYLINDGEKHPFALVIPGGGYHMVCSFLEGDPIARELNKHGICAFVLYYRCKKKARYPAPMEDAQRALREILENAEKYGIRRTGYSVWGFSAGGHLAATVALTGAWLSPAPSALILGYPVITMGEKTHPGSREALLGKNPSKEDVKKTSVELNIRHGAPPTFVWYGTADKVVDSQNSESLAKALEDNGVKCVKRVYQGVPHGVGLGKKTNAEGWILEALEFWESCESGIS